MRHHETAKNVVIYSVYFSIRSKTTYGEICLSDWPLQNTIMQYGISKTTLKLWKKFIYNKITGYLTWFQFVSALLEY